MLNASWGHTRIGEIVVRCLYQRMHIAIQEVQVMRSFGGCQVMINASCIHFPGYATISIPEV